MFSSVAVRQKLAPPGASSAGQRSPQATRARALNDSPPLQASNKFYSMSDASYVFLRVFLATFGLRLRIDGSLWLIFAEACPDGVSFYRQCVTVTEGGDIARVVLFVVDSHGSV